MREFFSFWGRCAKYAAKGNSAFANDWQWLVGYPVIAIGVWVLGYFYAEMSGKVEVTLQTMGWGALAAAAMAYVITWLASFVIRLLHAPVALSKITGSGFTSVPKIELNFGEEEPFEKLSSVTLSRLDRLLLLEFKNPFPDKPITACKLKL